MTVKHECSGEAYDVTGWHRCLRNATVEHDGQWYCWQHDPERVASDKEKRLADWRAESAREDAKYARIARNARLGKLVTPELAALLEMMATLLYTSGWCEYAKGEIETAEQIAARIREALVQEEQGE